MLVLQSSPNFLFGSNGFHCVSFLARHFYMCILCRLKNSDEWVIDISFVIKSNKNTVLISLNIFYLLYVYHLWRVWFRGKRAIHFRINVFNKNKIFFYVSNVELKMKLSSFLLIRKYIFKIHLHNSTISI